MKKLKFISIGLLVVSMALISPSGAFAAPHLNYKAEAEIAQRGSNSNEDGSFFAKFANWVNRFGLNNNNQIVEATDASLGPNINGITAPTVLQIGQEGTWTINASDPANGSLSYSVDWGDQPSTLSFLAPQTPVFVQSSTFTHTYRLAGRYMVKFTVMNASGAENTSTVTVHVVGQSVSTAPTISNFQVKAVTDTNANLAWTTDINSSSKLWYSSKSPVDTSVNPDISRNVWVRNHEFVLHNLTPNTTYYAVVQSANNYGSDTSGELSFTTKPSSSDNNPVITSVDGPSQATVNKQITETINAYDPNNDVLSYSVDWGDSASIMSMLFLRAPIFGQNTSFEHTYGAPGNYKATFTVKNSLGLEDSITKDITVSSATVTPAISSVGLTAISANSATIMWNTDEPANSQIFYSQITPVDVNANSTASVVDKNMTTAHSLSISGLQANTVYYFLVKSTDASGNVGSSSELLFVTLAK